MSRPPPSIRPRHERRAQEIDAIEDRLYEFNRRAVGRDDGMGLGFTALDDAGGEIGALAGYSWAGVAEIKQLWVAEDRRGGGLGRALVEAAVAEAEMRGCAVIWVMSYDFQAPDFYELCGFDRVAELADWPPGHRQVILRRRLSSPGEA